MQRIIVKFVLFNTIRIFCNIEEAAFFAVDATPESITQFELVDRAQRQHPPITHHSLGQCARELRVVHPGRAGDMINVCHDLPASNVARRGSPVQDDNSCFAKIVSVARCQSKWSTENYLAWLRTPVTINFRNKRAVLSPRFARTLLRMTKISGKGNTPFDRAAGWGGSLCFAGPTDERD